MSEVESYSRLFRLTKAAHIGSKSIKLHEARGRHHPKSIEPCVLLYTYTQKYKRNGKYISTVITRPYISVKCNVLRPINEIIRTRVLLVLLPM